MLLFFFAFSAAFFNARCLLLNSLVLAYCRAYCSGVLTSLISANRSPSASTLISSGLFAVGLAFVGFILIYGIEKWASKMQND